MSIELSIAPEDVEWWLRGDLRHCANVECRREIRECMGSVFGSDLLKIMRWNENPVGPPPHVRELCFFCAIKWGRER